MAFSIIVAADSKNGIGSKGKIPWQLPSDLAHFSKITKGGGRNAAIMGRKTWESLPEKHRPLKGRLNLVLTADENYALPNGVFVFDSLDKALKYAEKNNVQDIFIIGGANVYSQAIKSPDCREIILTRVDGVFDCDAFFPEIDENIFSLTEESEIHEENGVKYKFLKFAKKQ